VDTEEKEAMKLWKAEDPKNNKIKETRQQHDQGKIKELPWLKYLKPEADYKVFPELEEEISKKKGIFKLDRERWSGASQENNREGSLGYIQNAEQNPNSVWQRIKATSNE
jgi:hypothetical protein